MMMPPSKTTNQSLSKGWGILTQLLYPPFMGFGLGWLIEKKFPAGGLWMLGLLLLFFIAGLYGIIKSYLLELAKEASYTTIATINQPSELTTLESQDKTKDDA